MRVAIILVYAQRTRFDPRAAPRMMSHWPERRIRGFHQDDEGHWVAELECGHSRHVRHDPPWQQRPWVTTPEGRERFLGVKIECRWCGVGTPAVGAERQG